MSVLGKKQESQAKADAEALERHISTASVSTTENASVTSTSSTVTDADVSKAVLAWVGPKIAASTGGDGPRTQKLQITVTPAFYARVKQAAKERGMSVSDFLRRLIERVLPE